ncbi:hypothetical protein [Cyanobacterium sp. Dongsha4]|uniref:hypothetical protein n=1 Tax=Cyanobacterium sp. DS4 TaxID=2878255 RepID=UPI002E8164AD|nr:hypothetical protein [Cyanobacterium sp. Dongsha4]WVL00485.1 hypothetical protein Dongsha4_17835 [Cyanobacterium sp. Dongsha4]
MSKIKLPAPDLSVNPNHISIGDTVIKNNQIGLVTDIVPVNGSKVLQFWVKWCDSSATVPIAEIAKDLDKIPFIPYNFHDLVATRVNDGFIHSFIYHDNQIKAQIIKDSGLPILFSLEQLQSKLNSRSSHPTINIYTLTIDPALQQRVKLNQDTVADYAIALSEGEEFPPIIVWRCIEGNEEQGTSNSETLYLVDGFHRVEAAKLAKIDELPFTEKSGTYREAMLYTISVNADHGLRRNNADKRKAVMALLNDPEWSQLSTRELAKLAKVSHQLVHKMRIEIAETERRQKNLQSIKDYEEGKGERGTGNIVNNDSKFQYPEDAIKFLDDDLEQEDDTSSCADNELTEPELDSKTDLFSPSISDTDISAFNHPQLIPISKDTYSLLCDRSVIEKLEDFRSEHKLNNYQTAISKLINYYQENKMQNPE